MIAACMLSRKRFCAAAGSVPGNVLTAMDIVADSTSNAGSQSKLPLG